MKKISEREISRQFLIESVEDEAYTKLRILDFDDTIAETGEQVKLYTDNGRSYRMLSSDEFATYELQENEYYDESSFYQFDDVNVDQASPVQQIVSILQNFVNAPGSRKILILTARNQKAEMGIRNFLRSINVDDSRIDVIGVGSKDPIEKVKVIKLYIENNPAIEFVSFYDDSGKNVKAVASFLDKANISKDTRQVIEDEDGETRLVKPEGVTESIDFRQLVRRFLSGLGSP